MRCIIEGLYSKFLLIIFSAVTEALNSPGRYPGSSGTRNLNDNLSDLKAQVAANQKVELKSYLS